MNKLVSFKKAKQTESGSNSIDNPWKLLVVDDEDSVIYSIKALLDGFTFLDREIVVLEARSMLEAEQVLVEHGNIAVAILDVIMEEEDAGLQIVQYIRSANNTMRIILRTGHTKLSKLQTLVDYDIDGYIEKGRLGVDDIKSVVVTALRSYHRILQLVSEQKTNNSLTNKLEQLENHSFLGEFAHELYYHFQSQDNSSGNSHFNLIMRRLAKFSQLYLSEKGFHSQPIVSFVDSIVGQAKEKARDEGLNIDWSTSYDDNYDTAILICRESLGFAIKSIIENAVVFGCLDQQREQTAKVAIKIYLNSSSDNLHIDIIDNGKNKPHPKLCFVALHTACINNNKSYSSLPSSEEFNYTMNHHVGLNLTMSQFCVIQHDGLITLDTDNSETCFRIQIPVNQKILKSRLDKNSNLREFSYFRGNKKVYS